jgi:hypothetical protein
MHSAEGAMFPITEATLSIEDIADYWSREIAPPVTKDELLRLLLAAWWLGELRGDSAHSRLELLKIMFTSVYRDDLEIVFIVGDAGSPGVELPNGCLAVDLCPEVRVPSSNIGSWHEASCSEAFHALAEITKRSFIRKYWQFAVFSPSIKLRYEEFNAWCKKRRYRLPKFWKPPRKKSKLGKPPEFNWVGVRAKLATYKSEHGPARTTNELLQKCSDFACELHPAGKTPADKTIRDAIKTHALAAAAGLDRGK